MDISQFYNISSNAIREAANNSSAAKINQGTEFGWALYPEGARALGCGGAGCCPGWVRCGQCGKLDRASPPILLPQTTPS